MNKILASIAVVCDNGNHVLFREDGGDIIHPASGRRTPFRRVGNIDVLGARVPNPNWSGDEDPSDNAEARAMSFTRPGVSR